MSSTKQSSQVLTKTPVWQALGTLSWLKDIVISETLPADDKTLRVCELQCKVVLLSLMSTAELTMNFKLGRSRFEQVATQPRRSLCGSRPSK